MATIGDSTVWNMRYSNADVSVFGSIIAVSEDDVEGNNQEVILWASFDVIRDSLTPPPSSMPTREHDLILIDFLLSELHLAQEFVSESLFRQPENEDDGYADFCFNLLGGFAVHQVRRYGALHGRTPRTVSMQVDVEVVINELPVTDPPPRRPAPVPQLEKVAYEAAGVSEKACPICLTEFKTGEEVGKTPCGHPFHPACLGQWVEHQPLCPLCRSLLPLLPDSDQAQAQEHPTG